jgi:hypothetical protein
LGSITLFVFVSVVPVVIRAGYRAYDPVRKLNFYLESPAILLHGMKPPCDSSVHPTASRNTIEIEDIEARVAALAVRFVTEAAAKRDEEPPRRASS